MSITPQISAAESPYWIVVSDEGPATPPHKHTSYDSAYDESIRLAKLHPNLKFGVFKYQGGALSTSAKTVVTKWFGVFKNSADNLEFRMSEANDYSNGKATLYDSREAAENSVRCIGRPVGVFPVEIITKADPKVTFTTYYESAPTPIRYSPWGTPLY